MQRDFPAKRDGVLIILLLLFSVHWAFAQQVELRDLPKNYVGLTAGAPSSFTFLHTGEEIRFEFCRLTGDNRCYTYQPCYPYLVEGEVFRQGILGPAPRAGWRNVDVHAWQVEGKWRIKVHTAWAKNYVFEEE